MQTRRRKIHSPQAVGATRAVTAASGKGHTAELVLGLACFAALVPLLVVMPREFPVASGVISAATVEGYNTQAAYAIAAVWLLVTTLAAAVLNVRRVRRLHLELDPSPTAAPQRALPWLGMLAVFLLVVLAYFPPFLAQGGPFIEDQIHLTALHRMLGGQRPYVDFEFLYGPLMLYPAWAWTQLFGYTPLAFYGYVALIEGLVYAALFGIVWLLVPDRRWRTFAFLILAGLFFNALVGPNWSASRRIFGLLGLVVVAHAPLRVWAVAGAAALLGLQLAYSHDVGVAALAAAGAVYAVLLVTRGERMRTAAAGLAVAAGAAVVWYAVSLGLLRDGFGDYIAEAADLTARFSAGEAGLRFYWTVNSLAVFGAFIFAGVVIGAGLTRNSGVRPGRADLLLAGAFVYGLVALKSGLNRADVWHLDAAIIPLALALLVPAGRRFDYGDRARVFAAALLGVVSVTYAFGVLPSASLLASGWVRGAQAVLSGDDSQRVDIPQTAAPMIGAGRFNPGSPAYRLATLFAQPQWRDRHVLFYSDTWPLPRLIGVFKTDPINDDFLYSDQRGMRARHFLEQHPDALVVISEEVYNRMYSLIPPDSFPEHTRRFRPTVAKRMANWLSTTHYRGLATEVRLKDERWRRTVGVLVRERYRKAEQVGRFFVLEPVVASANSDNRP